jgi:cation:H+ antiporter
MSVWTWSLAFCVSLGVLVAAANLFINAAEQAGKALRLQPFITGVILVGFGTSLPELISSILAVNTGSSEIVIGNVVGSNITNILLILGLSGLLGGTFYVKTDLLKFDLTVMLGGAFILSLMVQDHLFSTGEGIICLLMMSIYLVTLLRSKSVDTKESDVKPATARTWPILIASPVLIFVGAKYTVDSVIALARIFQVGVDVIAMSAVAFGTSLPEIVVAITASYKGKPEIVVGNVIGSNIFNTFGVMGIPSLIGHLNIPDGVVSYSVPVFLAATMIHVIITVDRRVSKAEGAFMLCFYLFFVCRLFGWL